MTGSQLRNEASLKTDALKEVPVRRSVSIATSKAQNDSGVFEFNFNDERYMPFEGAGAVSRWKLSLPDSFRQFYYDTISDVIMHISYTAEEDGGFREKIEPRNAEAKGTLLNYLKNNLLSHIFSLRHDFPNEWHQFVTGQDTDCFVATIKKEYFPYFAQDMNIHFKEITLYNKFNKFNKLDTKDGDNFKDLTKKEPESKISLEPGTVLVRDKDAEIFLVVQYNLV